MTSQRSCEVPSWARCLCVPSCVLHFVRSTLLLRAPSPRWIVNPPHHCGGRSFRVLSPFVPFWSVPQYLHVHGKETRVYRTFGKRKLRMRKRGLRCCNEKPTNALVPALCTRWGCGNKSPGYKSQDVHESRCSLDHMSQDKRPAMVQSREAYQSTRLRRENDSRDYRVNMRVKTSVIWRTSSRSAAWRNVGISESRLWSSESRQSQD